MTRQRDELGIREYPLFTHDEVDDIAPIFQGFKYNREIEWAAFHKIARGSASPILEFYDAGHTLGSAGILVRGKKETLFYTGDVCFHDQTLLETARFDGVKADVLIMETTRGNRATPPGFSREKEMERLVAAIQCGAKAQRLRPDSRVCPGPDPGNPRHSRPADARGKTRSASPSISAAWARCSPKFTTSKSIGQIGAHRISFERSAAAHRPGKGPGRQHEILRRQNFRHHRRHDERKYRCPRSGRADDWR